MNDICSLLEASVDQDQPACPSLWSSAGWHQSVSTQLISVASDIPVWQQDSFMLDMDTDKQELVKVVLVGDSGVGKTRLVCARAYLQSVPLSTLVKTHVPTIWAIDQYRIYKDV